jgi:hypothetical protein
MLISYLGLLQCIGCSCGGARMIDRKCENCRGELPEYNLLQAVLAMT